MVAGIYGMNFDFMSELGWRYGDPIVGGGMVVAGLALDRKLKQIGWL